MLRGNKIHIGTFASIVLLLIISGCVSTPPEKTTSTPTSTPIPVSSPAILPPQPQNLEQPSWLIPTINVTSYPANVIGKTDFTIQFEVSGGTKLGNISHASVHWGFKNGGAIIEYGSGKVYTGTVPQQFSSELIAPASGIIYFWAHAIIDGVNIFSNENEIKIIPDIHE
jgi:hypothetical protein